MPNPLLAAPGGLGFFRLERSGLLLLTEPAVEPLEDKVVDNVCKLPFVPERVYGFPLASVTDTPPPGTSYILSINILQ